MADDERRAEIEAVARLEYERSNAEPWTPGHGSLPAFDDVPDDRKAAQALGPYGDACWSRKRQAREEVERIVSLLDRLRDARGDDEAGRLRMQRDVARRNFRMLDERAARLEHAVKVAVQELPLTRVDSEPSEYHDGPSRAGARLRLALRAVHPMAARSPQGEDNDG